MTEMLNNAAYKNKTSVSNSISIKKSTTWNFTALICFTCGATFAVSGLFMNFTGYFFESGNVTFEMTKIGTALICIALPLMFFGAHAVDKISENKRKRAVQRTAFNENK